MKQNRNDKKGMDGDDDAPVYDYCKKRILVLGVGNRLFGDDGFGPAVIEELQRRNGLPKDVYLLDVGTSARGILFNVLLSEVAPETLIIVDSVGGERVKGKRPGAVLEVDLDTLGAEKSDDFQFHFVPTSNMLVDLRNRRGIVVVIIACVVKDIPQEQMRMGLSEPVAKAVSVAADLVVEKAKAFLNAPRNGKAKKKPRSTSKGH
jgi:coenzyme F420 hydrogenase subunit delta